MGNLESIVTWTTVLKMSFLIVFVYFLLTVFAVHIWTEIRHKKPLKLIRFLKFMYWPLSFIIFIAFLVASNPILFGLIMSVIALPFWAIIRNFYIGSYMKFMQKLTLGESYEIEGKKGTLAKLLGTTAKFKTDEGFVYMPYSKIIDETVTLLKVKNEMCAISLYALAGDSAVLNNRRITKILYDCPIINWTNKPVLNQLDESTYSLVAELKEGMKKENLISFLSVKMPEYSIQTL